MSKPPKIVIPGLNRGAGIPGGYILGRRRGSKQGPAELLNLTQLRGIGIATTTDVTSSTSLVQSIAHSETVSLSRSVSSSLSAISSAVSGAVSSTSSLSSAVSTVDSGQKVSLSQISSSLSGAISSTTSLSSAVSTVISGSISTVTSMVNSLSTAGGGGGGGSGSLTLITETVTSGSAVNVSFTSISGAYRDLIVRVRGRGTTAATVIDIRMQYNADTGANYDTETHRINNTTTSGFTHVAQTSLYIGDIAAASATATIGDFIEAIIGDYRGTTFQKAGAKRSSTRTGTTAATFFADRGSIWWRSTAAITRIDVFPTAGGFVDGSVVSLYGCL